MNWLHPGHFDFPDTPPRGDRWLLVALAASGVLVNQSSFTGSLALTNADNVAMISATTPVLVAIWLAWRSRERFRGLVWFGLGLGLLGLGLVVGAGHWSGLLGIGIALLNPLSWAVYLILLPRLLGRYRPLTLVAMITVLGAVMLVPLGVVQTTLSPPHPNLAWVGLLAYSSLGAVALTTWMYLPGVSRLGPGRTAMYSYPPAIPGRAGGRAAHWRAGTPPSGIWWCDHAGRSCHRAA